MESFKPRLREATEHFDFGYNTHELSSSRDGKRNVRNEITNKSFEPNEVIDAFESAKGIKKRSATPDTSNYTFKNIILDPEQQRDQDMLNELMNNKKYMIVFWKDTWTNLGNFRVFVVYGQRKEDEKEKA